LAFTPPNASSSSSSPAKAKVLPEAHQRQLLLQSQTLVKAYWEFNEAKDRWLGFSSAVSGLLEAAYQNWLQNPGTRKQPQVHAKGFLYNVDYASMDEASRGGQRQSQSIRRVGVTAADAESPIGGGAAGEGTG
ncbi:unnamed protein product, partial [Polarella glacialis]